MLLMYSGAKDATYSQIHKRLVYRMLSNSLLSNQPASHYSVLTDSPLFTQGLQNGHHSHRVRYIADCSVVVTNISMHASVDAASISPRNISPTGDTEEPGGHRVQGFRSTQWPLPSPYLGGHALNESILDAQGQRKTLAEPCYVDHVKLFGLACHYVGSRKVRG